VLLREHERGRPHLIFTMEEAAHEQVAPPTQPVTGDLRLHEFRSGIFRNTRMLRIWLPPRYDAPENVARHYPVLYLNDGQNLFDRATAFAGVE
jgi:enterochelin esterase-like enzyme